MSDMSIIGPKVNKINTISFEVVRINLPLVNILFSISVHSLDILHKYMRSPLGKPYFWYFLLKIIIYSQIDDVKYH